MAAFEDLTLMIWEKFLCNASPSMRLDHLAHRRSEIDVINGAVVDRSHELGLAAPVNQVLCAVVRARESRFP